MKSKEQIQREIKVLEHRGRKCKDNERAQSSIQGQIDVLMWVSEYACSISSPEYA